MRLRLRTPGSPPRRRCQKPWESTTSSVRPICMGRPIATEIPMTSKKLSVTHDVQAIDTIAMAPVGLHLFVLAGDIGEDVSVAQIAVLALLGVAVAAELRVHKG